MVFGSASDGVRCTDSSEARDICLSLPVISIVSVFSGEGPPVPIPNTEVKLTCADDTWLETTR